MITKAHIKKLIADVSHLINNEVDAEGNPLTNETEMLLREELIGLTTQKYRLFG